MSGGTAGVLVDADAGNEVIGGAGGVVDGNAGDRGPGDAVGGRTHDDVIRLAAGAETAVLPNHVHGAGSVNFGGGKRRGAETAGDAMFADAGNGDGTAPGGAAVGCGEGLNSAAFVGNHDGAVQLNDGLSAEAEVRGRDRGPGKTAIARSSHFDLIAKSGVVPLNVAMAEKRAARAVVAGHPGFVGEAVALVDGDGIVPVDGVGGAADQDDVAGGEAEGSDHPYAVLGVEGDGRIAGSGERSALEIHGDTGQEAVGPGGSVV